MYSNLETTVRSLYVRYIVVGTYFVVSIQALSPCCAVIFPLSFDPQSGPTSIQVRFCFKGSSYLDPCSPV